MEVVVFTIFDYVLIFLAFHYDWDADIGLGCELIIWPYKYFTADTRIEKIGIINFCIFALDIAYAEAQVRLSPVFHRFSNICPRCRSVWYQIFMSCFETCFCS